MKILKQRMHKYYKLSYYSKVFKNAIPIAKMENKYENSFAEVERELIVVKEQTKKRQKARVLQGLILALGLLNTFTNNLEKGSTWPNIRGFRECKTLQ